MGYRNIYQGIEMYLTHSDRKSVIAEIFIKILMNIIYIKKRVC